jgi:hypothetical protein
MTWALGTPTMWGYAAGIADIRVSFPDGSTLDCLQKVYPVGRFIAAAFSGSVRLGFWAIEDLTRQLELPVADADVSWKPGWVAFKWWRRARREFAKASAGERALGLQILLLGVSAVADLGIPWFPRPTVVVFKNPEFRPKFMEVNAVAAIGSGAVVEVYMARLREFGRSPLWQLESAGPGASMAAFTYVIHRTIVDHPTAQVSPHLHLCLVRRGEVAIANNDAPTIFSDGRREELRMPPVATSWAEFEAMCQAKGLSAAAASATGSDLLTLFACT